jgi:PAS domain S-box-containing protein
MRDTIGRLRGLMMSSSASRFLPRSAASMGRLAIFLVYLVAGIILIQWFIDAAAGSSFSHQPASMKITTAVCLLLTAAALLLLYKQNPARWKVFIARIFAAAVCLIGFLTVASYLIEFITGHRWPVVLYPGLDLVLAPAPRMVSFTAIFFSVIAIVLLLFSLGSRQAASAGHFLLLPASVLAYVILAGYFFNIRSYYEWITRAPTLNAGIAFCALSFAAFCARTDTWMMRVIIGDKAGAVMMRRLLLALLIIPLLIVRLLLIWQRALNLRLETGMALAAVISTACLLGLVWISAKSINRTDDSRRSAEGTLRDERNFVSAVLDIVGSLVVALNREGQITRFNRACEKVTGYSPDEVLGRVLWDFLIPPEEVEGVKKTWSELKAGHFPNEHENHWIARDGSRRLIAWSNSVLLDETGEIRDIIGTGIDITERKKREAELYRLNRTLTALSNSSLAMVRAEDEAEYLKETCRIVVEDCGHAMVWIGYAENDETKTVRPIAHAGFEEGYLDAMNITWADTDRGRGPTGTAIRTGKPSRCRNMLTDPNFAPWRENAIRRGYRSNVVLPLMAGDKAFGAINIYSRESDAFSDDEVALLSKLSDDLAYGIAAIRLRVAHAEAENELRKTRDELELRVQERTAELQKRSTQLRTLALELSQTESRERRRLAEVLHDHLQQLLVSAKYAAHFAHQQSESPARESITEVAELLDESIKASRSLTIDLSPPILQEAGIVSSIRWLARWMLEKHGLTVEVDADAEIDPDDEGVSILLFQCVRELLFNVVKHAGVDLARVSIKPFGDDQVEIIVSDNGPGFDTATAGVQGTDVGFGLFSIRERIDFLGGRLDLESAIGIGTRITILAPMPKPQKKPSMHVAGAMHAPGSVVAAGQLIECAPGDSRRRTRVLVADDHKIMREGLIRLLQAEVDIEVIGEASDGQMAVKQAHTLKPDVIIMDVSMPRLNGVEATRRIVAETPGIRIIGLSMFEEAELATAMLKAGATAYLAKDGPSEKLIASIRNRN